MFNRFWSMVTALVLGVTAAMSAPAHPPAANAEEIGHRVVSERACSRGDGETCELSPPGTGRVAVDNVPALRSDAQPAGEYRVTVRTSTNGAIDEDPETAGGSLRADRAAGTHGDIVALTTRARPGYVFAGYDSFVTETGTSTDGLLTITDDTFTLDDKTGSVTIVAKFVDEPLDRHVVFRDHFDGELNGHGRYSIPNGGAAVVGGELILTARKAPAMVIVEPSVLREMDDYQVELQVRKTNVRPGTLQVPFRMGVSPKDRYVLALTGTRALLRRLDDRGGDVELAGVRHAFGQDPQRILIDVCGDRVSVSAEGEPVLSYQNSEQPPTDAAKWSDLGPAAGVINMTPGAPVSIDNLSIRRVPEPVTMRVDVVTDAAADPGLAGGTVTLSSYRAAEGDTITWQAHPRGGHEFMRVSLEGQALAQGRFTVPAETSGELVLRAEFRSVPGRHGTTYHIDAGGGDDAHDGLTPERAWRSFNALQRRFQPGDEILLKAGNVFSGQAAALRFLGSGTAGAPIRVGTYGQGPRPRLDGAGEVTNVVQLYNQEHVIIEGLEITNTDTAFEHSFALNSSNNRDSTLRGVNVFAHDFGVVTGITLRDLHIHDINGSLSAKWNGGIFFDVTAEVADGALRGVPTKYDGILIEDNVIERVDRSGIKLVSSAWANQSAKNEPTVPLHWLPSTNVVLRGNVVARTGGDAITVRDTDGALIEHNVVRHARYQNTGYNAGIWPFEATNTVIQYNEVSHTHGVQDGQGLDTDHLSLNTVIQYNYSHNNQGGFMLIMNGFPHTAPTIRYNISQNDADKTFEFSRGTPAGTMIYNNTIYSKSTLVGPRGGVLHLANSAAGTGNREVFLFNNVFHYPKGQPFYVGEAATMRDKVRLLNNAYLGGIEAPAEEERAVTGEALLTGPGSAPDNEIGRRPLTGGRVSEHFAGYVPGDGSSLTHAGMTIEDVLAHYGGRHADRRHMRAVEVHDLAKTGKSIEFIAGRFLPALAGVSYGTDFLGRPLPDRDRFLTAVARGGDDGAITVGAVQGVVAEEPTPTPTQQPSPPTLLPSTAPTGTPTDFTSAPGTRPQRPNLPNSGVS